MLRALNRLMLELEFELVIVGPPKEPLYKNMLERYRQCYGIGWF